jgi:hypothetical protein
MGQTVNREDSTMTDTKCNGWANYATWRINLEMFDGFNAVDEWGLERETLTESVVSETTPEGLALDYALAFMSDVNWYEIASHMLEDY